MISVAVRWYLRYGLTYRDVEELLAEFSEDLNFTVAEGGPEEPAELRAVFSEIAHLL